MSAPPDRPADAPPRGLLLAAAGWVLLSLIVAYGVRPPVLPLSSTYAPAARITMITMLAGAVIGWPLLRLSQRSVHHPVRRTLLDLVVLTGALQVTLWPLRLAAAWPVERTVAIDAWCIGWMLVAAAAAIVGGRFVSNAARTVVMAVVLVAMAWPLLLAPWLLPATTEASMVDEALAWWSPFGGLARLAAPDRLDLLPVERTATLAALATGLALATAAALLTAIRPRPC